MLICGIDPGGCVGVAVYDTDRRAVTYVAEGNDPTAVVNALDEFVDCYLHDQLTDMVLARRMAVAIEGVTLYRVAGQGSGVVGESTFAAARQVGWFAAQFGLPPSGTHIVTNPQVRSILLGHLAANQRTEAMVNQHLRDSHGGDASTKAALAPVTQTYRKDGTVWRKGVPGRPQGALYGVTGHIWSALACAVAYAKREGLLPDRPCAARDLLDAVGERPVAKPG